MVRTVAFILLLIIGVSCKNEKSSEGPSQTSENTEVSQSTNDTIKDLLKVTNPREGQLISSPLEITGEARGYWFFEATATVELVDSDLNQISGTYISATEDWMTEDWVPFSGTLNFENPGTQIGFLILHKANASGLKEHDLSDTIAVRFR